MSEPIKHENDLVAIVPMPPASYKDISLTALTVYSLFWLHQWDLRRTIEAIAILNWRLFPNKFGMVGFPQYPDAFRTNRSLMQAQPKYRNWLTGSATTGFSLNARGIEMARELLKTLGAPTTSSGHSFSVTPARALLSPKGERARSIEPRRVVERVRSSRLYEKWKAGIMGERDLIHVHSLLGAFDHTPIRVREKLMKDLERSAHDVEDAEVLQFLRDVRGAYPSTFSSRA